MAVTLVQSAAGGSASNSGTGTLPTTTSAAGFAAPTTAGNLLVLVVWINKQGPPGSNLGGDAVTATTTPGISWVLAQGNGWGENSFGAPFHDRGGLLNVFYKQNAPALSPTDLTTVSTISSFFSSPYAIQVEFCLFEFAGAKTSGVRGNIGGGLFNYNSLSNPLVSAYTSSAGDLMFGAFSADSGGTYGGAGSGFTLGPSAALCIGQTEFRTSPGGSNQTPFGAAEVSWASVGVQFLANPSAPVLQVVPTTLNFSGVQGGMNPASQNIAISNTGTGTLNWSIASDQAWLSVGTSSGSGNSSVAVNTDITGLTQGSYIGHLTVTATGASGSPATVTVNLTVGAPSAVLALIPSTLEFVAPPNGANPASKITTVYNVGTPGPMAITVTDDQTWLSVTPTSGDAGTTPVSLTVSVDITGLVPGSYSGTITVASAAANNSPQTVAVTLFIVDVFNYVKSFGLTGGGQRTITLDESGTLWEEDVVSDPFVLHPLLPTVTPGARALSATQADVEYICFSNLKHGTDIPRQYNPQPASGGYTLDRISQVGPGAPPTFATTTAAGAAATITSWAGVGSVVTFQAVNAFTAGEIVTLSQFVTSTFFNGKAFSVLGTGLSGTQFEISFSGYSGGSDTGTATPQYGYRLQSITQPGQKSDPDNPGTFPAILWSTGPGQRTPGNVVTVYYATRHGLQNQDTDLVNQFNSGLPVYVYVANAPFGNGTHLVTSVGSGVPLDAEFTRWYFTFQVLSTNFQSIGGQPGYYQRSLASIVMNDPIPALSVGDQVTMTNVSPAAWNAAWTVIATLNSGLYSISQTQMTSGMATYTWAWAGSGPPVAPTVGQLVTVIQTLNGNGIFNVVQAPIASVAGGPSNGTFTVGNFPTQNIPAASETGQAETSGTRFQIDPGVQFIDTNTSPIFGNAVPNVGIVAVVGSNQQIGPGTRQAVVFFETRNGFKTPCSAPITFTTDNAATYILASNIPIGPPNVIRRWIAFTGAGPNGIPGPNFYTIDTPITYTINNQTYRYSATFIDDNVTTSAKFTFTDAILLAGEEVDVQGNNLFAQIELGSAAWNIAYASRMFYGLEENKVLNFNNLSFDGGYLPSQTGNLAPLGWGLDPDSNSGSGAAKTITGFRIDVIILNFTIIYHVTFTASNNFTVGLQVLVDGLSVGTYLNGIVFTVISATPTTFTASFVHTGVAQTADSGTATPIFTGATLRVSPVFGDAYYISNQLGSTQSVLGMIIQNAFQDAYNVPIILPNTLYSVRVTARIPSGKTVGNLVVDLTDSNAGNISGSGSTVYGTTFGSFVLAFASMTETMAIYSGTLLTSPFTIGVPAGLLLRYWAQNIGNGGDVEVDRIEVFPTASPILSTNVRVSYLDNFEAFDANTGNIGLASHNTQPANGAFILHDQLYFLKSRSLESTQDIPGVEPSGPGGGWSVHEVSNEVGACGIYAYDYGEEWVLTACRNGLWGFNGGQPIRIDFQQKEIWDAINWTYGSSIVVRNDITERRILVAVPLPTPNQWLPLAATNANPTTPNVILMWNYQGLGTFEELVNGQGMHTTMFGTLKSTDMRIKMTIWQIPTAYIGLITQPDLLTQLPTICGTTPGKLYQMDPDTLSDDGAAINALYTTYGFVNSDKSATYPLLGFHRKRFSLLQQLISGSGNCIVQVFPNFIINPKTLVFNTSAWTVPGGINLQEQPPDDIIRPLNSVGNRVYVMYQTNAVGAAFNLSKMIMVGTIEQLLTVNPNSG